MHISHCCLLSSPQTSQIKEFEAEVKGYAAETQRISAVQAGMSPDQIQDIVMGTIAAAVETGDISGSRPMMPQMDEQRGAMGMQEEPVEQMGPME